MALLTTRSDNVNVIKIFEFALKIGYEIEYYFRMAYRGMRQGRTTETCNGDM